MDTIYTYKSVTSKRKTLRLFVCAGLLSLTVGCSGINMSKSVSPLDFFLPGLLRNNPPSAPADFTLPEVSSYKQVALVR